MARNMPSAGNMQIPSVEDLQFLDRPLRRFGFEYKIISPEKVTGRLKVTKTCCQPSNVLSGGVSSVMAESVASLGAYVASGFHRMAGIQLSANHIGAAHLGDTVEVEAQPIQHGRTIQVWEVQISRINTSSGNKALISTIRVTLVTNLPSTEDMKGYTESLRKHAKL